MRVVLQRVTGASVTVEGEPISRIGLGYLLLVGIGAGDGPDEVERMADKIFNLRVFADDEHRMNRSLSEVGGEVLVVSQFTLYGDASKGRRPSFINAAPPTVAIPLYERFIALLKEKSGGTVPIETGEFGAMMDVELVNDGPVTLLLER